jgi:Fe2+ transport system protein FeoA
VPSPEGLEPLASARTGATGTLALDQVAADFRVHLARLGLRSGAEVTVLTRTAGGGRLVAVGTSRIGLDRDTCRRLQLRIGTHR